MSIVMFRISFYYGSCTLHSMHLSGASTNIHDCDRLYACVCVCVCMHVCKYVYVCMCVYVYMSYIHTYIHNAHRNRKFYRCIWPSTRNPFLSNGASYRLEKRFAQLARRSFSGRCKKRSATTSRSQDFRRDKQTNKQTDRQTHTHKEHQYYYNRYVYFQYRFCWLSQLLNLGVQWRWSVVEELLELIKTVDMSVKKEITSKHGVTLLEEV